MDKQTNEVARENSFLKLKLILNESQCHKLLHIFNDKKIANKILFVMLGKGTVNNTILNVLGIKNQKKEIITILIEKEKANETLDFITEELHLDKPGKGIAYITNIKNAQQSLFKKDVLSASQEMEGNSMYKKLTVIVNRGMAEDVMDIARNSGVKGGTILHGRGSGSDEIVKLFGMVIEPEKELILIVTSSEIIDKVIDNLHEGLQLDIPGNGIIFVEDLLDVRGLFDEHEKNE